MRSMHVVMLVCLGVTLLPVTALSQNQKGSCAIEFETRSNYQLLTSETQKQLGELKLRLCAYVDSASGEEMRKREAVAISTFDALVIKESFCRSQHVNPAAVERWQDSPAKAALHQVVSKYCRDVSRRGINTAYLLNRADWLRNETFCQNTRYFVDPGGWKKLFKPDVPSWKKLEDTARSLCEDLRQKKRTYSDAIYEWEQALIWTEAHLPAELGRQAAGRILNNMKSAFKLIPKMKELLPKSK